MPKPALRFRSVAILFTTMLFALADRQPGFAQPATEKPAPTVDIAHPVLTETVGLLAGIQLYQTYLNIGLIADAKAEGVYELADVQQILGTVLGPLEKVEKQLEKVSKLKLSKDDVEAVTRLRKIARMLREQGSELQAFWETGKNEHGNKYESIRQSAWKELSGLLELEPTQEKAPAPREIPNSKR